jgi:nucleotide-binding universal stress UspA family protein
MRILVATDGSRAGVAAVKFAAKLTRTNAQGQLIVLTVNSNGGGNAASRKVIERAARMLGDGQREVRFQVVRARQGDEVPDVISREANRLRADMLVVGSEGRDTLDEWVVGGTALRLIYVSRRPVTVVRAPRRRQP